ncbi:hypothetical protein ACFO0N_08855 [Halobium salinum]|uniref:Integral membrane protein n=1 Tax=Halobium salinum TaxID=1364940 RepID=A0ABD5PC57_9EURY|nr:hypothetical protein [Halobium salinum]
MTEFTETGGRIDTERSTGAVRPRLLAYAIAAWVGMVVVALLNATLRELFVTPVAGDYPAHVVSTLTLLVALGALVYVYFGRVPMHTRAERWLVGALWAGLTVAFELLFGHFVAGDSWASLLELYDVTAGRIWVLVPLFLLVAPVLVGRLSKR